MSDADFENHLAFMDLELDAPNGYDASDVKIFQENVAVVAPSILYDNVFTCNCPVGAKRELCKHVIVVEVYRQLREWPNIQAIRQTLTDCGRNPRGRPRNHTAALNLE